MQATDGNFYGTTYEGGAIDYGTVFKITPAGTLTTLYSFCSKTNCADGYIPYASLVQATDGNFYGTTTQGDGAYGNGGTVFKITPSGRADHALQLLRSGWLHGRYRPSIRAGASQRREFLRDNPGGRGH